LEETMSNPLRPAHILTRSVLVAAVLAAGVGTSRTVQAQEKCGETECPKGYTCETGTAGCPAIACMDGEVCKPCEPAQYSYCVPAACETDADCGAHMKCAAIEQKECTGETAPATEPCEPNTECKVTAAPVESVECTTTTIHQCQPQWTLPCETAADCGEGFACKEQESCWCSGSSGSVGGGSTGSAGTATRAAPAGGASSGGAAAVDEPVPADDLAVDDTGTAEDGVAVEGDMAVAPPPDEQCGCEPTGEFACKVVETACTQDSDCPADWTCEDNPMGVCWADSQGNSGCTPADPAKLCQPPYSDLGGGGYYDGVSGGTTGAIDLGRDDGESNGAQAPQAADPGADGSAASGDPGPAAEAPEDADEQGAMPEEGDSTAGTSAAGGGCSVSASTGRTSQFGLMLVAAIAALGLRRRSAR
jgi:hypothetical protein